MTSSLHQETWPTWMRNRDGRCCSSDRNGVPCSIVARPGSSLCQLCADNMDKSYAIEDTEPGGVR
jgi:hypothetical protein